jgi:hypothetical protein
MTQQHATPAETIATYLTDNEIEYERADERTFAVVLPGEHRLRTTVSLVVGDYSLSVNAFVVRNPDENHEQVYRWLLRRNQRLYAVSYAIDHLGDVYLVGKVSLSSVSTSELDRLFGTILENSDGVFDYLLELGFETAIRREWKWRLDRGESTRNLAAFKHLADPTDGESSVPDST